MNKKLSGDLENKNLRAVHAGISGFPFGSAAINKCLAVYGSLQRLNVDFLIINNRAIHNRNIPVEIKKLGKVDGMDYIYTTPSPYRSDSMVKRNLSQFLGRVNEFLLLIRLGISRKIDVMFYYPTNGSFFELILYRLLSKIFNFVVIAHYVEFRTAFVEDMNSFQKLKHKWFDKYFMYFTDAVLPISEFLIRHLEDRGYKGPLLKVPPLTDFTQFNTERVAPAEPFFLYVGSAAYLGAIEFITKAFDRTRLDGYGLYLVVNGTAEQIDAVKNLIQQLKKRDKIKIFSKLKYSELVQKYVQAKALLIPLTNSVTDVARFPQKISEYLASGNPVVTTNCGEIPYYFKDHENALVASGYIAEEFAKKLDYVMEYPEEASLIGKKGRETGMRYFDFNSYGPGLKQLILSLQAN